MPGRSRVAAHRCGFERKIPVRSVAECHPSLSGFDLIRIPVSSLAEPICGARLSVKALCENGIVEE